MATFAQREATSFAIQATAQGWIKGAYYSLSGDRFVVTDAVMLQTAWFRTLCHRQPAGCEFAAVTIDRLRGDGCDLRADALKPALAALPMRPCTQPHRWPVCLSDNGRHDQRERYG